MLDPAVVPHREFQAAIKGTDDPCLAKRADGYLSLAGGEKSISVPAVQSGTKAADNPVGAPENALAHRTAFG
jgi:hypothetical protein